MRNIEVTKRDSADKQKTLAGAEFDLYEIRNGKETKVNEKSLVTNSEGKLILESLDLNGHYELRETKAPAGYELSKKATEIDVKKLDSGEALIKIDVYNDGKKDVPSGKSTTSTTNITSPKTGDKAHMGLYAGVFLLSILLASVAVMKRRAFKNNK